MNEQSNPLTISVNTIKAPEFQSILLKSLPKEINVDKFTHAVVTALRNAPHLFVECDRNSLYNAIVDAARRGLIPDGKQGALVPFNTKVGQNYVKKAQFMIMPQGIIDSLAKVGITVYAQSVYENDEAKFWSDDKGQHVDFKYDPFASRGERVGSFACAQTKDGKTYVETANLDYIERVKKVSRQRDTKGNLYGPWIEWPEKMEQKTALHLICKRLPTVDIGDDDEYKEAPASDEVAIRTDPPAEPQASAARTVPEGGQARPKALQKLVDSQDGVLNAPIPEGQTVERGNDGDMF